MRFLLSWWVFFPLAALLAAASIVVSLGPMLLARDARPAVGARDGAAFVFAGDDLAHPAPAPHQVFHVARTATVRTEGLRVAVLPGRGEAQPEETGVQVLLAPETSLALGEGPFRVEVQTVPVPITMAPRLAIGLDRGGQMEWRTLPLPAVASTIVYEFPRGEDGAFVNAIGVRPAASLLDYNYGVELRAIRIMQTPAGAAAP